MAWSAENQDYVPEEGNSNAGINDPGSPPLTTDNLDLAWYNLPFQPSHANLVSLYAAHSPPVPENGSIFSCPAAPVPLTAGGPTFLQPYFMYGMNARLCINFSTRRNTGVPNTRFGAIPQPRDTVFMAEPGPGPSPSTPSQGSSVTGYYVAGSLFDSANGGRSPRHLNMDNFFMCDGHVRTARTNEFDRTQIEADSASTEWSQPRQMYWYPTPNTPN
jgi:prepilin-type processing-associated H-X9-DG protein